MSAYLTDQLVIVPRKLTSERCYRVLSALRSAGADLQLINDVFEDYASRGLVEG